MTKQIITQVKMFSKLYSIIKIKIIYNSRRYHYSFYRILFKTEEHKLVEALSKTIGSFSKLMSIQVILCFFCIHTLLDSSDKELVITSSLNLPFRLGQLSYKLFILFSPIILMIIRGFQQVYYEHWQTLDNILKRKKTYMLPIVSFHNHPVLCLIKHFNLYLLIPFSMIFFIEKSFAVAKWGQNISLYAAFVALIHLWFLKRSQKIYHGLIPFLLFALLAFCTSSLVYFNLYSSKKFLRPLNLKNIDLCQKNLTEFFLEKANLEESDLREAKLWRTNLQFSQMKHTNLYKAQLWQANLYGAQLQGANLDESYLLNANLEQANLEHARLKRANLRKVNLSFASLKRAYLKEAKLEKAVLYKTNLKNATIKGAYLHGADFSKSIGLTQKMINKAHGDRSTKLPRNLIKPKSWLTSFGEIEEFD